MLCVVESLVLYLVNGPSLTLASFLCTKSRSCPCPGRPDCAGTPVKQAGSRPAWVEYSAQTRTRVELALRQWIQKPQPLRVQFSLLTPHRKEPKFLDWKSHQNQLSRDNRLSWHLTLKFGWTKNPCLCLRSSLPTSQIFDHQQKVSHPLHPETGTGNRNPNDVTPNVGRGKRGHTPLKDQHGRLVSTAYDKA